MNHDQALILAIDEANRGPCAKSQRGVILWSGEYFVTAYNAPPWPLRCTGTDACRKACGKICVHAEQAALLKFDWSLKPHGRDVHMLHVKTVDDVKVASGPPSCWQCSRLILEAGVDYMWLLHDDGLRRYAALEFHRLTLQHCGLPTNEHTP